MLLSLQKKGYNICILSSGSNYLNKLKKYNFNIFEINFSNSTKNICSDLNLLFKYYKIYKKINPDLVLHNAIKPNIYGSIICRVLKIPVINNVSGLGSVFISNGVLSYFIKYLYKISQLKASKVFFQNKSDLNLFKKNKLINLNIVSLLPGSGVDIMKFHPKNKCLKNSSHINFCFIGRLIKEKGILEYIYAAKLIISNYKKVSFSIIGGFYEDNPSSINYDEFHKLIKNNRIHYLGNKENIDKEIGKFDCIILPSYREGMSRALLEACSTGIPIIAANVPGCKEIVDDGKNGFLCQPKDYKDLFYKIKLFLSLSNNQRKTMGKYAREKILNNFDERYVIKKYYNTITEVLLGKNK